jgi:arginyl-tRNA synthetase
LKPQLEELLQQAVNGLVGGLLPTAPSVSQITVERTRDAQHGDFASNVALQLAKTARRSPRELAQAIATALPANDLVERTEVAGAGFINF